MRVKILTCALAPIYPLGWQARLAEEEKWASACVAGEGALQTARDAHEKQDLDAAVLHATAALEHFSAAESEEGKQAASKFLEQLSQARNQARAQVRAARLRVLSRIIAVLLPPYVSLAHKSSRAPLRKIAPAQRRQQHALTRRDGAWRAQELLAAGEAALSRDQVAAARAAGDEARQAAEDCASIPLIRQVEALLLRVEAREESLLNREQGVHVWVLACLLVCEGT
jgi:hypothetical protein